MGLFQTLRQKDVAHAIDEAQTVVLYAAPGISPVVAEAIERASRRSSVGVVVILDARADTARLGYGGQEQFKAIQSLHAARIDLRVEVGLRQGLLIVDNGGWAITLPPELVEAEAKESDNAPNAVQLTQAQVAALRGELPQPARMGGELQPADNVSIGGTLLTAGDVERETADLKNAPPQQFDLARRTRVFSSRIQFVDGRAIFPRSGEVIFLTR